MMTALMIVGGTWTAISMAFVVALGMAASKPMPVAEQFQSSESTVTTFKAARQVRRFSEVSA